MKSVINSALKLTVMLQCEKCQEQPALFKVDDLWISGTKVEFLIPIFGESVVKHVEYVATLLHERIQFVPNYNDTSHEQTANELNDAMNANMQDIINSLPERLKGAEKLPQYLTSFDVKDCNGVAVSVTMMLSLH